MQDAAHATSDHGVSGKGTDSAIGAGTFMGISKKENKEHKDDLRTDKFCKDSGNLGHYGGEFIPGKDSNLFPGKDTKISPEKLQKLANDIKETTDSSSNDAKHAVDDYSSSHPHHDMRRKYTI